MKVEFEWAISEPFDIKGTRCVKVRERIVGHDQVIEHGPMPAYVADSFIKARRAIVQKKLSAGFDAQLILEPSIPLIHDLTLGSKGKPPNAC